MDANMNLKESNDRGRVWPLLFTILGAVLMAAIMITTYFTDVFKSTLLFGIPFTVALVVLYFVMRRKSPQA